MPFPLSLAHSRPRPPLFSSLLSSLPAVVCTALVAAFLWLPPALLFEAALQSVAARPERLLEVVPWKPLPRFLFANTLGLAAISGTLAMCFGVAVGVATARGPKALRAPLLALCALPLALPPMLLASAWLEVSRTPPARSLASLAAPSASTIPPLLLAGPLLALCFFPIVAFAVRAALLGIAAEAEDAARLLDGSWGVWRRVLWPLLWPAVAGAAGIVMALSMWEMGAPDLLDARTYSVEIYRNLNAPDELDAQGKAVKATLAGVPMLALGALALWPAARALRRYEGRLTVASGAHGGSGAGLAPARREGMGAMLAAMLVLLAAPIAPVAVFVGQLRPPQVLPQALAANDREAWNTLGLATSGALLITVAAFVVVTAWREWPQRWRRVALLLCVAPALLAPVLTGVALVNFWNRPHFALLYGGAPPTGIAFADWLLEAVSRYGIMLVAYAARFLPLAILIVDEAARRVDVSPLEAARNLGAGSGRAARTVLLPALAPSLLGTFALVWALCGGELSTSVLVNQPGGQTLPVPIFNQMHIGSTAEVAALSLSLFAMCGGVFMAAAALLAFFARRRDN